MTYLDNILNSTSKENLNNIPYSGNTSSDSTVNTKIEKIKNRENQSVVNNNLRRKSKQNVDYRMDGSVKQLFLNLTKMQIPFNFEKTLEPLFPKGMKKDEHGNYHIKIGDSKTMFCGHLDTYCYEYKRVWHIIEGNIIKTDGTTTLGGDDKAGITVMIKMIEAGIPGLYYFFRGEEGVTSPSGTWGSKQALKSYEELFKTYDRCIAFDRKANDSIITKQMYSTCCSKEFTKKLLEEFSNNGLTYRDDPTGGWCDSGVFMKLIPECTNISIGYKNEHTFTEIQDIDHLEKLVEACINTNWEDLPVKRDPTKVETYGYSRGKYYTDYDDIYTNRYDYGGYGDSKILVKTKFNSKKYVTMPELFKYVKNILSDIDYECFNGDLFKESEEMYFQNIKNFDFFGLKIIDYDIYISTDESLTEYEYIGDIDSFEDYVMSGLGEDQYIDDQHLKSISSSTNINTDDEEYIFTNRQNLIFREFVNNNKDILLLLMESIEHKDNNDLSSNTWLKVQRSMTSNKITLDYGNHGINPDDLCDWVSLNWLECKKIIDDNTHINDIKITTNKLKSGENNIFTTNQINTFTDIALNKKSNIINDFIHQVIKKHLIDNEGDYIRYIKNIEKLITDSGYKISDEINYEPFLDWLKINYKDIEEYNGI